MRVIAKKRCLVMVEPPEKGERATLNPWLLLVEEVLAGGRARKRVRQEDLLLLKSVLVFSPGAWEARMADAVEILITNAIHTAFIKYPEGDGGPNLDYEWIAPDQSTHIAKAILLDLAANGYQIVKKHTV